MARGTVVGEQVVSQAGTDAYREGYDRIFGKDHKPERGRWSFGGADETETALCAPIIADRIHEGTAIDVGDRVVDIGSRAKRRAFMRETGLADATDCSPRWLAGQRMSQERQLDRKTDGACEQAARKLYQQGRLRD